MGTSINSENYEGLKAFHDKISGSKGLFGKIAKQIKPLLDAYEGEIKRKQDKRTSYEKDVSVFGQNRGKLFS